MRRKTVKSIDISIDINNKLDNLSKKYKRPKSHLLSDMILYFDEIQTDPKEYKGFRDLFARWMKAQEKNILYPIKNRVEKNAENMSLLFDKLESIDTNIDFISDHIKP